MTVLYKIICLLASDCNSEYFLLNFDMAIWVHFYQNLIYKAREMVCFINMLSKVMKSKDGNGKYNVTVKLVNKCKMTK